MLGAAALAGLSRTFDVASIKRNTSGDGNSTFKVGPAARLTASNVTLDFVLQTAYRLKHFQLVGLPEWASSEHYDIIAKGEGEASADDVLQMTQRLLADRFQFVAHTEKRERPVYALTAPAPDWKPGLGLTPVDIDCDKLSKTPPSAGHAGNDFPECAIQVTSNANRAVLTAGGASMATLGTSLEDFTDRLVIDRTGITRTFNVKLSWSPNQIGGTGVSLFTAVQEQLGLKLESSRAPVGVLVVDHLERPTPD